MRPVNNSKTEIIQAMTHKEYMEVRKYDKTLQFQFNDLVFADERKLLKGIGKIIFYFFMVSYMLGPLIIIPIIAYRYDNWYLLFGILFSYFSTFLSMRRKTGTWVIPFVLLIWFWFSHGFHLDDYLTFFWISFFLGGLGYQFALHFEEEYAKIEVLKSEDLFNSFSQKGIIFFMKKTQN